MYCRLLMRGTELPVNWPQPWWPLHASELLWKWLKMATEFPINHHLKPKWDPIYRSVLFEKRMLHLWLSSRCACSHVIIHSPITLLHMPCPARLTGSSLNDVALGFPFSGEVHVCGWLCLFLSHTGCNCAALCPCDTCTCCRLQAGFFLSWVALLEWSRP